MRAWVRAALNSPSTRLIRRDAMYRADPDGYGGSLLLGREARGRADAALRTVCDAWGAECAPLDSGGVWKIRQVKLKHGGSVPKPGELKERCFSVTLVLFAFNHCRSTRQTRRSQHAPPPHARPSRASSSLAVLRSAGRARVRSSVQCTARHGRGSAAMPAPQPSPSGTPATPGGLPWKVELAPVGAQDDAFGGCRAIETSYKRKEQIGEGTYGQVRLPTSSDGCITVRLRA